MSLELTHPDLLHPRTGEPLHAVGILPSGRIVWPIMGGDGTEGDANDEGGNDGDAGNGDDQDQGGNDQDQDGDQDGDTDARVQRANRQAATYRTQLRESERAAAEATATLDRLRQAITGEDGDGETDANELTGQVESLTTETAQLRSQLLVHELAGEHNGNPVALLDSNSFTRTLHGLDPADDDYRDQVAAAIKDAVGKNRNYRAGQGSSRGGGELDGDRRENARKRPTSVAGAIGGHYSGK